jgi:hypothetical protein
MQPFDGYVSAVARRPRYRDVVPRIDVQRTDGVVEGWHSLDSDAETVGTPAGPLMTGK